MEPYIRNFYHTLLLAYRLPVLCVILCYRIIENRGTADEMEIYTNYYRVELNAVEGEDLFHDEVDYTRTQPRYLESENSAVSFPHRVIMGAQIRWQEDFIEWEVGQEIFVAYDVVQ